MSAPLLKDSARRIGWRRLLSMIEGRKSHREMARALGISKTQVTRDVQTILDDLTKYRIARQRSGLCLACQLRRSKPE